MNPHYDPRIHRLEAAYEILLKEMKRQEMGTWDNQHFRRGSATTARKQAEAVINQKETK